MKVCTMIQIPAQLPLLPSPTPFSNYLLKYVTTEEQVLGFYIKGLCQGRVYDREVDVILAL
jgi:hypothetical protein